MKMKFKLPLQLINKFKKRNKKTSNKNSRKRNRNCSSCETR